MLEVSIDIFNEVYNQQEELVSWFKKATPSQRVLAFDFQNKLFSLSPKQVAIQPDEVQTLLNYKRTNTPSFTYCCFLFGCNQVKKSKKGRTNEVDAAIKKEKELRILDKQKSKKFKDKFKRHYFDVKGLRNEGASWTLIAQYIAHHHAKYYQGYTITASYLRRTFNELTADFEKASTLQKL